MGYQRKVRLTKLDVIYFRGLIKGYEITSIIMFHIFFYLLFYMKLKGVKAGLPVQHSVGNEKL